MNLKQLRELAEAAVEEETNPKGRLHFHITEFYNTITATQLLALLDLVELQHDALLNAGPCNNDHYFQALAAYEQFNKEK